MQGTDGALYGTTATGGSADVGTAFKLSTDGTSFSVLRNFDYASGAYPYAGLTEGTGGALFGAANQGGSTSYGTLFTLNTDGSGFSVLQTFSFGTDYSQGAYPYAGPMQAADGALYGVAYYGGSGSSFGGTAFKLNTDGSGFVVRHDFNYF